MNRRRQSPKSELRNRNFIIAFAAASRLRYPGGKRSPSPNAAHDSKANSDMVPDGYAIDANFSAL